MPDLSAFNKVRKEYKNFIVTKFLPLDELKSTLIELTHTPTGAKVMHIACDDKENVFCISFRTLPKSSNGAPHILEHTVLCGSKKFPVKDPFFSMTRRSLNTFMNAFTGSDFTCYPASSQNTKDFYNLLEVYLDAAFFPELKKMSFLQEGHRLEFKQPQDPSSPLVYKGVVFNEMKGALSSPDSRMWEGMMEKLLPDLPYSYDSGGNPKIIPALSYEDLIDFHKYFYHPSHCLFYFYGNLPLEGHLDFIEKNVLSNAVKKDPIPPINEQKHFNAIKEAKLFYPTTQEDDNAIHTFGWLTSKISDQETTLALCLLDSILMDTDASILRFALLQSGLCTQAMSVLDSEMSEVPWIIICKGCKKEDKDKIYQIIMEVLNKICDEKIPLAYLEAALHQLEFSRKEIVGDRMPYGLILFLRAGLAKQNGCESENALQIHALFDKLLKNIKKPEYLPSLIEKYFINNTHQVHLTMLPDPDLSKKEEMEEKEILQKIKDSLSKEKITDILKQTQELKKYHKEIETQSIDCLPKVTIKDIPNKAKDYQLEKVKENLNVFFHKCFTNHIVYADLIFNLNPLTQEQLPLASLLFGLLTEVDMIDSTYQENLQYIQLYLGGVYSNISLSIPYNDVNKCQPILTIGGKALYRNCSCLFSYLKKLSTSCVFNNTKRIKELILQLYTYLEQSMASNALRYAKSLSQSGLSFPSYLNEHLSGIHFYHFIKEIVKNIDDKLPNLIEQLEELKNQLLPTDKMDLVITCDEEQYLSIEKNYFYDLFSMERKKSFPWKREELNISSTPSQGRIISSSVAFTSLSYQTVGYSDEEAPYLLIASKLMQNVFLHKEIREMGGAYGGGATYSTSTGQFSFYGYRDPHITSTKTAFLKAIDIISSSKFSDKDLEEAKLGIIQDLDDPIPPSGRGLCAYYWQRNGKTYEKRYAFREKVLKASKENIANSISKHLLKQKNNGIFITFAGKEIFEKEKVDFLSIFPL